MIAKIGIITTSDRASAGIYEDLSGKAIIDTLNSYLKSSIEELESNDEIINNFEDLILKYQICKNIKNIF